jgi:hypothetical protein
MKRRTAISSRDQPTWQAVAGPAGEQLDLNELAARVDAVLGDELYWFPVRHHSPAVARYLDQVIRQRLPRLIFIEGPAEASELIPHLVDSRTRPPVAIYSSFRDDDNRLGLAGVLSPGPEIPARFASWYPLLSYSPELVALQAADKIGARVVFFDLPHWALIRQQQDGDEEDAPVTERDSTPAAGPPVAEVEQMMSESDFYLRLAAEAGYRSWDEAWDSLFERHLWQAEEDGLESFRRELATFCAAARATANPAFMGLDGTLARERNMSACLTTTMAETGIEPAEAMVVCGGFHLFMDRDDPIPPPQPPEGTVYTTVVPYAYSRLTESAGYGAGNRAPRFFQTAWDLARAGHGSEDLLVGHVLRVIRRARRRGEVLSSADAIAVTQHTRLLARLRGRGSAVLDDIRDGLLTCCAKGPVEEEGQRLLQAMTEVEVGARIGRVTEALGRLPIVNDFYAEVERLELTDSLGRDHAETVKLDRRQAEDRERSVFFHRLHHLAVPLARRIDTSDGLGVRLFSEHWRLRWQPQVEAALVEQNLYGDTVEAAALARLEEQLSRDQRHAGRTARRLLDAFTMDLAALVPRLQETCRHAIDTDSRFISLSQALGSLLVLERQTLLRGLRQEELVSLIELAFARACFALANVASAPQEEEEAIINGIRTLAEVFLDQRRQEVWQLDGDLFVEQLELTAAASTVPFLRGAYLGILVEVRALEPAALAAEITGLARSSADEMIQAGDLLAGVLTASRATVLLGAEQLVAAVDELLRAAEWEPFLMMLPRLRAAFDRLPTAQLAAFSERVAQHYGLREVTELDLDTSVAAASVIARIDHQVAEIMTAWDL